MTIESSFARVLFSSIGPKLAGVYQLTPMCQVPAVQLIMTDPLNQRESANRFNEAKMSQ